MDNRIQKVPTTTIAGWEPDILEEIKKRSKKLRSAKTKENIIKKLPGRTDNFGKKIEFDYVEIGEFYKWLDNNYPGWSWQVDPMSANEYAGSYNVIGTLTIIEPNGLPRVFTCVGSKRIKMLKDKTGPVILDYFKAAETDALKRCVSRLGGFNDIYTKSEFESYDQDKLEWFFEVIYPIIANKISDTIISSTTYDEHESESYTFEKLKNLIMGFLTNKVTRQDIEDKFLRKEK